MIVDREGAKQAPPHEMAAQYTDDLMCLDLSDTADLLTDNEPHQMDLDVLFNAIVSDVTQDEETILTSHLEDTSQVEPHSPLDDPSSPESFDDESLYGGDDGESGNQVKDECDDYDIPIPTVIPLVALEVASDSEWEKEEEKPQKRSKRKRKPTKKSEYMESISNRPKKVKVDKSESGGSAKGAKVKKAKKEPPVVVVKEEKTDSRLTACANCGHHGNKGTPVFCPSMMYPTIRMNLESPPEALHTFIVPQRPAPVKQELTNKAPCVDNSLDLCSQPTPSAKGNSTVSSPRRSSTTVQQKEDAKKSVPSEPPCMDNVPASTSPTTSQPSRSPLQEALSSPPLDSLAARLAAPACPSQPPVTFNLCFSKSLFPLGIPSDKLTPPSPLTPPGLNRVTPTSPPMWMVDSSRDELEMGERTPSESSAGDSPPPALLAAAEQAELDFSSEMDSEDDSAPDSKRRPVEKQRLERRRYNNRVAAQRCRQRKREHFQSLKKEIQDWECQNTQLRYEIHVLRKQVQQMTTMWTEHAAVCKRLNPKLAKSKRKHKHRRRKLLKAHPELVQQVVVAV